MRSLTLYGYWRSSAAYRVRIALNLKGLEYAQVPVHLVADGGQQHDPAYRLLNPQELVPVLIDGRRIVRQSLAIIEYLEETSGSGVQLLPSGARERARVRSLALLVACDIHPLANLRVLQYLEQEFGADADARLAWSRHWIAAGLAAFEELVAEHPGTGAFCDGDTPTLADACLVPQMYNARRVGLDLTPYPNLVRIDTGCNALAAFADAAPERQPDAPKSRSDPGQPAM